jgi:hypothetical protein
MNEQQMNEQQIKAQSQKQPHRAAFWWKSGPSGPRKRRMEIVALATASFRKHSRGSQFYFGGSGCIGGGGTDVEGIAA